MINKNRTKILGNNITDGLAYKFLCVNPEGAQLVISCIITQNFLNFRGEKLADFRKMCNFATEIRSVAFAATTVFTKNRKNYGRLSGGQLQTHGPGIADTDKRLILWA